MYVKWRHTSAKVSNTFHTKICSPNTVQIYIYISVSQIRHSRNFFSFPLNRPFDVSKIVDIISHTQPPRLINFHPSSISAIQLTRSPSPREFEATATCLRLHAYSDTHSDQEGGSCGASIKFASNVYTMVARKEKEHLTTSALYAYSNELAINWY